MGIDLYANSVFCRRVDDRIYIQRVPFATEQNAPRRMPDNINIWIGDSAYHPFGLLFRRQIEQTVDRRYHEIQACQRLIREIERAIAQDVAFGTLENKNATRELLVQMVDLLPLACLLYTSPSP